MASATNAVSIAWIVFAKIDRIFAKNTKPKYVLFVLHINSFIAPVLKFGVKYLYTVNHVSHVAL